MPAQNNNVLEFSIVIPCYNEADSLQELYARLTAACAPLGTCELIFVDDGSSDATPQILRSLHQNDQRVKIIRFRKNFGKALALSQGFRHARGRIIVTLDADLQDRPEEITALLGKLHEGYDLVSGWKKRRHDPLTRRIPSRLFNLVSAKLTGVKIHDFNCGLKAYRREVTESIELYGEIYRFIPALASWRGFRVGELEVQHEPRKHGISKFGNERFLRGFFDLLTIMFLTKYTQRPLHLFGGLGLCSAFAGLLIDGYLAVLWFAGQNIGHRPLLTLGILLIIIGIQFVLFGLLGELVVFSSSRAEDAIVKDTHGLD